MTALEKQIGGDHYKGFAIQPGEFSEKEELSFFQGCVLKRICRFDLPGGKEKQDLEKIIHEIDLIIECRSYLNELNDLFYNALCAFLALNDLTILKRTIIFTFFDGLKDEQPLEKLKETQRLVQQEINKFDD